MDLQNDLEVAERIHALHHLITGSHLQSDHELKALVRHLRPVNQFANPGAFHNATLIQFRRKLNTVKEGPVLLTHFNKQYEICKAKSPYLIEPFTLLLYPLSFPVPILSTFQNLLRSSNLPSNSKKFDISKFSSLVNDQKAPASRPSQENPSLFAPNLLQINKENVQELKQIDLDILSKRVQKDVQINLMNERGESRTKTGNEIWISPEQEKKLIVDIIYILGGVNGTHIKFDIRSESYVVDPSLHLHPTVRDIVLCICELGWLYNRVHQYRESVTSASTSTPRGLVIQAFAYALNEELIEYRRLLAVLEQEISKDSSSRSANRAAMLSHRDSTDPNFRQLQDFESKTPEERFPCQPPTGLTLLRLKAWMQEPTERMFLMARLVDCASTLTGGALASRLHAHSRHGDLSSSIFVQRVMDSVCAPIFSMLTKWMLHGEVNDQHKEFFIGQNPPNSLKNLWKDMFYLRSNQIPIFISAGLVDKILNIGKSITFIKLCLDKLPKQPAVHDGLAKRSYRMINKSKRLTLYGQVVDVVEEQQKARASENAVDESESSDSDVDRPMDGKKAASPTVRKSSRATQRARRKKRDAQVDVTEFLQSIQQTFHIPSLLEKLRYNGELLFSKVVYQLSNSIDAKLLNLMRDKFFVREHLLALKKFMLLGQGDFITCLMDNVGPELKKKSSQLFRHNLISLLETSVRSSNAQYEPAYIVDRISVRLSEATSTDTGWDVFSLDYVIDTPLNAIVHYEAIANYRIAFHMLWRLKRVEWSLTITWKQFLSFSHSYDHLYRMSTSHSRFLRSQPTGQPSQDVALKIAKERERQQALLQSNATFISAINSFLRELKAVFHTCNLTRAHMMHVVNNLSAFLMFEVMETTWMSLEQKIDSAQSLNDVIVAHDNYLTEILERSLLSKNYESLNIQLQKLLNLILEFCYYEENLVTDAMAYIARQRIFYNNLQHQKVLPTKSSTDDIDDNVSLGGRSLASVGSVARANVPSHEPPAAATLADAGISQKVIDRMKDTIDSYHRQFELIMNMLKEEGEKSNDILRFLTFRLDFNDFHSQRLHGANSQEPALSPLKPDDYDDFLHRSSFK